MKAALVMIFAEADDDNDRRSIEHLVHALRLREVKIRCQRHRTPFIMDKNAIRRKRLNACQEIAVLAREAKQKTQPGEKIIVIGFHDTDAIEPAHLDERLRITGDLRSQGVLNGVAATPAAAIEAWWMLFPEALARTRQCWSGYKPPRNVGSISDPKTDLIRGLRQSENPRCPDYKESDSVAISRNIKEMCLATDARTNLSASLACFRDDLRAQIVSPPKKKSRSKAKTS